jgi:hypothetical protein
MTSNSRDLDTATGRWLWIVLLTIANVVLSGKFACATPFAALAALASLDMSKREGLVLVGAMWLSNQIVGFAILSYPHEMQTYAWGLTMGLAALVALYVVFAIKPRLASLGTMAMLTGSFAAAFAAYEAVLLAATFVLPNGESAFTLPVVRYVTVTNVVAFVGLLILHRAAVMVGLLRERGAMLSAR